MFLLLMLCGSFNEEQEYLLMFRRVTLFGMVKGRLIASGRSVTQATAAEG